MITIHRLGEQYLFGNNHLTYVNILKQKGFVFKQISSRNKWATICDIKIHLNGVCNIVTSWLE